MALCAIIVLAALLAPVTAFAAPQRRAPAVGTLTQLHGRPGCLVDRSTPRRRCTSVRALKGPAPFLGSQAVAMSPRGRDVYVASSRSNAIAIFRRNARTGRLTQAAGAAGCIAVKGASGCATARALRGPNSVTVSPDGRNVYATALKSNAVIVLRRNVKTGALSQAKGAAGCVANAALPGCTTGRALLGPDVVVVSPDGANVYVGAFFGNAVAVLNRNKANGALTQPADTTGCLVNAPQDGCATGLALGAPEGMAVSADGNSVYVAAALSNAVDVLSRGTGGALTQATDGTGCIVAAPLAGCTTGTQLGGANAVRVSPDDADVYVTSLTSNSLTSFTRTATTGQLAQKAGTSACVVNLLAIGCSLGRSLRAPEGLAVSPDGASVYAAAFASSALDGFDRNTQSGGLSQQSGRAGCLLAAGPPACRRAHGLRGVSSLAVSPDGRYVYSGAFASNAVGIFARG